MNGPGNIYWLASYPKSGNTWFRVFLTNLFNYKDQPADINNLAISLIASSRNVFDEVTGVPSSELSFTEILNLRPDVYKHLSSQAKEPVFQKIHDAYIITSRKEPLIPYEATKGVIYFIRNPLDIVVSFAYHSACSFDKMIQMMNDPGYMFCRNSQKMYNQLSQKLFTWSGHVKSWTEQSILPVHIIKYEDMITHPFETFKKAIQKLNLNKTDEDISRAMQYSNIKELQKQENEKGFSEKSSKSVSFFRKGKPGSWKEELNQSQVKQVIRDHNEVMQRFGYLNMEHDF